MREKASLANRLQCVLLLLMVARTAAIAGVPEKIAAMDEKLKGLLKHL
jgi:hypothetical protein